MTLSLSGHPRSGEGGGPGACPFHPTRLPRATPCRLWAPQGVLHVSDLPTGVAGGGEPAGQQHPDSEHPPTHQSCDDHCPLLGFQSPNDSRGSRIFSPTKLLTLKMTTSAFTTGCQSHLRICVTSGVSNVLTFSKTSTRSQQGQSWGWTEADLWRREGPEQVNWRNGLFGRSSDHLWGSQRGRGGSRYNCNYGTRVTIYHLSGWGWTPAWSSAPREPSPTPQSCLGRRSPSSSKGL